MAGPPITAVRPGQPALRSGARKRGRRWSQAEVEEHTGIARGRPRRPSGAALLLAAFAVGCVGAPADGPAPPRPSTIAKAGSGFFLGEPGRLVTAAHLVAGCGAVRVVVEGGGALPAALRRADARLDVAELQVRGAAPPSAELATALPPPGAALTVLGYAEAASDGTLDRLALTLVTLPIPRPPDRLPLHGPIAHAGMSGAPVVDARGRVAGMLLGRGDAAAPGSAALARRIGYPVAEVAVAVPARWLPQPGPARPTGAVTPARVLCLTG